VGVLPLLTFAALVATALVPLGLSWFVPHRSWALLVLISAVAGVALTGLAVARAGYRARHALRVRRALLRPMVEMALHLSPVVLLTLVFPIASERIAGTEVGGAGLTELLLASSLTVPWLSQAVCLPMYRAIGPLMNDGDMDKIQRRFVQVWPTVFLQCLPVVVLFAVPVEIAMGWSVSALAAYLMLCILHLAFAQSLVVINVARRRVQWAVAWACYAGALFLFPTVWYLPPLVGLFTQLVLMRRHLRVMRRPVWLDRRDVARDLGRGLLLGSVLWSDKLMLFLKSDGVFEVNTVFLALLPAILAYNYYFVRLAPIFDGSVEAVRTAMEHEGNRVLSRRSTALSAVVTASIGRTALLGAGFGLLVTCLVGLTEPTATPLVAAVSVASWFFMMNTVLCYKLDYIGQQAQAQAFSAVHLVACLVIFLAFPVGPALYAWLVLIEAVLFAVALQACLTQWRSAEYALFWRHATAW
jgi:hypothetical protein